MGCLTGCMRTVSLLLAIGALVSLMGALYFPMLDSSLNMNFPKWVDNLEVTFPATKVKEKITTWVVTEAGISVGKVHLIGVVGDLWSEDEYLLSSIIFLFSIVFPLVKIFLTIVLSISKLVEKTDKHVEARQKGTHTFLKLSSKWSMTDVFIVALTVVFFKAKSIHFEIEPERGFYFFMCAAFGSSFAVQLLDCAADQEAQTPETGYSDIRDDSRKTGYAESDSRHDLSKNAFFL